MEIFTIFFLLYLACSGLKQHGGAPLLGMALFFIFAAVIGLGGTAVLSFLLTAGGMPEKLANVLAFLPIAYLGAMWCWLGFEEVHKKSPLQALTDFLTFAPEKLVKATIRICTETCRALRPCLRPLVLLKGLVALLVYTVLGIVGTFIFLAVVLILGLV